MGQREEEPREPDHRASGDRGLRLLIWSVLATLLVIMWGVFIASQIRTHGQALRDTDNRVAALAAATAQYAELVGEVEHRPPLGEQPVGLPAKPQTDPAARMVAVFLAEAAPPEGTRIFLTAAKGPHHPIDLEDVSSQDRATTPAVEDNGTILTGHAASADGQLVVTVTLPRVDALVGWWRILWRGTIVFGLFTAFALGMGIIIVRQLHALELAKETAEEGSRSKSHFLACMSHELRTPLNAILGFSEMLKLEIFGALGDARYRDYAATIFQSGQHLLNLINDVLDLAKLEVHRLELEMEPVDIRMTVRECLTLMETLAKKGQVRLACDMAPSLPPVRADARRLKQIVLNLLSNAVKFTPKGGEVRIGAHRQDERLVVIVSDTGIGIDENQIAKALEPFGQIRGSVSIQHEGTGLGLPLTKELVELHGGTFRLESAPNRGTIVTMTFPLASAAQNRLAA